MDATFIPTYPVSCSDTGGGYTRPDGIKMNYDPYHPDMIAKYGAPGERTPE
jgi:hypothetical protein